MNAESHKGNWFVTKEKAKRLFLLLALLFSFVAVLFAVIGVNIILIQIFLVPFIIILLSIYYPGQWYISLFRSIDVAIGGAIAVAMVYLKGLKLS